MPTEIYAIVIKLKTDPNKSRGYTHVKRFPISTNC